LPECKSPPQEWLSCCCDHSATDIKEFWWLEIPPGDKQPAKAMRPPQLKNPSNKSMVNAAPSLHIWILAASSKAPHATSLISKLQKLLKLWAKASMKNAPLLGSFALFRHQKWNLRSKGWDHP
jgi:hypothetical protein